MTREQVLDTAARLFGERGIVDTSMNRIAAEAGVSIGTVYRYFGDRSAVVEELLARMQENIEQRFTERVFGVADKSIAELAVAVLGAIADELVVDAGLVRALAAGLQFPDSGIPELERRLRLLVKVLVIQVLGPGDDRKYDAMTIVLVNTGFAAVMRAVTLEVDDRKREELFALTARGIAAWVETEGDCSPPDAPSRNGGHALSRPVGFTPPRPVVRHRSPRQERAKATREHILNTAAQLFAERGVANTSTNRIAAEAGVSIGTVYRYFTDRTVMVEELIQGLMEHAEQRLRQSWLDREGKTILEVTGRTLEVIVNEVTPNAELVRALVAGVHFYRSGIPDFEPRLRELATELIVQTVGPGDDRLYDAMSFAMINTGFAAVLRAATLDLGTTERTQVLDMTARLIAAACEAEIAALAPGNAG
ncbi:TetR/AcrR family transcriptional regulator [Nocardia mexicana]|uniref:TetR/AcrR family transcriptional regulator n=1 Tax=Nocardia mexicana TaxID=279262 RepID=UPI001FEC0918|nr:TetR/AcrR family transcriptional regulator [Nocardia mexicana]